MNMNKPKRAARITRKQKEVLIQFLEDNPQLARGRVTNKFTNEDKDRLWNDLKVKLENPLLGRTKKSVEEWKRTWVDLKLHAREEVSGINKHMRGTGGGSPHERVVSPTGNRIIGLVGSATAFGHALPHEEFGVSPREVIEVIESPNATIDQLVEEEEHDDMENEDIAEQELNDSGLGMNTLLTRREVKNTQPSEAPQRNTTGRRKQRQTRTESLAACHLRQTIAMEAQNTLLRERVVVEREKVIAMRERLEVQKEQVVELRRIADSVQSLRDIYGNQECLTEEVYEV